MKFRTIKAALLSIVLSLVVLGMLTISLLGYINSKSIINNEITEKMGYQINYITEGIEKNLLKHEQLATTLAKTVEAHILTGSETSYISAIEKVIITNEDTYGSGIWFEPYSFDQKQKYFGPYAYKENDKVHLTMDYNNESYDYPNTDWYISGKNAVDHSAWSLPYYDETSNVTMITTSVPFVNSSNQFLGVVTADIDLVSIQKLISDTKVGETGWAFLLDANGTYIADKDIEKVMQENILNQPNQSLLEIGKEILENKNGRGIYFEESGKHQIYYAQIPKTEWIIGLTISEKELYASLNGLLINTTIILFISIIAVSIGIVLYTNNLSKNMVKLKDLALSLSNGDFTVKSDIKSLDETGILSSSFNDMIENVKSLLTDVTDVSSTVSESASNLASTSEEVSASADEIARTVEEIARGAEEQARDAEKGSTIAILLDTKFEDLIDNTNIMHENANAANDANQSGINAIRHLMEKTDLNSKSIVRVEKAIEELNKKSSNIGSILETISDIANQTNLLSLNASIEAARAGEAGKGFAVVAGEIRKLADESESSASQIRNIVEGLQLETNNAVQMMKEVKLTINEQVTSVDEVEKVFDKINESVGVITGQIGRISTFIDTISDDKDHIVHSIENIAAVSEEAAAAAQEVTASMEQQATAVEEVANNAGRLNELSINLNDQISKFKI